MSEKSSDAVVIDIVSRSFKQYGQLFLLTILTEYNAFIAAIYR